MKNCIKLKLITLIFSLFFIYQTFADEILPVKKPNLDQETKDKIAKSKEILPQKKPSKTSAVTVEETKQVTNENSIENTVTKSTIYPKKSLL